MLSTSPGQRVCVAYWTPVLGPKRALFVLPALGVPISEVGPSGVFDVGAHSARAYNPRQLWLRLRRSRIDVQATPRGRATPARLQIIVVERRSHCSEHREVIGPKSRERWLSGLRHLHFGAVHR
jgi:hypothetical protein